MGVNNDALDWVIPLSPFFCGNINREAKEEKGAEVLIRKSGPL